MYVPFQNQVQEGELRVYNANGTIASTFTPSSPVANSDNQRTVLVADSGFGSVFPSVAPDFTDTSLDLSAAAGAVCWPVNSSPIDCASWGAFTGNASLPSSAGSPFQGSGPSGAIADGKAIIRSISAGCPTFLEDGDDTGISAADFSEVTPNPQPNALAPTQTPCAATPPPANPTSPINPAGSVRKRKCKKRKAAPTPTPPAYAAKKKKCKKKRRR